jgi:hypothetical protein
VTKTILGTVLLIIFAVGAWKLAMRISPDAVGMAIGMLFGVLAGLPTAALMLASNRRSQYEEDDYPQPRSYPPQPPQQTIVVVRERIERGEPIPPANRWDALELSRWKALPPLPDNGREYIYKPVADDETMEW